MQGYTPIIVFDTEAAQRRPDPRVIAASGYPLPGQRRLRQRLGALLIALGAALLGPSPTLATDPEPTVQGP
jgi:hypothetical protein